MIKKNDETKVYKAGEKYIRSTKHEFGAYLNTYKLDYIEEFIDEYRYVAKLVLDELWNRPYTWEYKGQNYTMWLQRGIYNDIPKFMQTGFFNCLRQYNGELTGRAKSTVCNQVIQVIKGLVNSSKALNIKKLTKPDVSHLNPEISSKHCDFEFSENTDSCFQMYICIHHYLYNHDDFVIPIKLHKVDRKYDKQGRLLTSIMLTKESVNLKYEMKPKVQLKKSDNILGIDIGQNKLVSLSNRVIAAKIIKNKKTFDDIADSMKVCKKGSKGYKRKIKERDDFINENVNEVFNQFDLTNYTRVNLESNKGIKESTKNANAKWATATINNKILRTCQNSQVDLFFVPPQYKSQRCFVCGYVHSKNRHKESFRCKNCYHVDDADINAALNNSLTLPYDKLWSFKNVNRGSGFFWLHNGCSLSIQVDEAQQSVPQHKKQRKKKNT